MKTELTTGMKEEQASEIRVEFLRSVNLRNKLVEICEKKINSSARNARDPNNYEKAAWPYLQADQIGYSRALYEIISLLTEKI